MKQCVWKILQENPVKVECINCGVIRTKLNLVRACNKQDKSIISKTARFAKEFTKWQLKGGEYRTNEEIDYIYNSICTKCPFFIQKEKYGECDICGCNLKPSEDKNLNKIAMSTTRCPHDPPKWTEVEGALEAEKAAEQERLKKQATSNAPPAKKKGCGCKKT